MISRHYREAPRDQDIADAWDMDPDDDNWSYDGEPKAYRRGNTIVYAMLIAMVVIAAVVIAGQYLI